MIKKIFLILIPLIFLSFILKNKETIEIKTKILKVSEGWAGNSINTVIFRRNSIVSYKNKQYMAFYDENANVILARRKLGTKRWEILKTKYKGNIKDAHNSISIMIDGDGYLHMSWNQHGDSLQYCRGLFPESLDLGDKITMTGHNEQNVTYPEFYKLPDGGLLFLYRDGSSGNGNLVINQYNTKLKTWTNIQKNLIDGEGQRNAYWQATIDRNGGLHLSWVWRESWDVATNHDICYAKSSDNGISWEKSTGEKYKLPITLNSAECIATIPQGSELINQTSMSADSKGNPYISGYWVPVGSKIPQYQLVYYDGNKWITQKVSERKEAFSLSGGGTKRIPISRPQIMIDLKDRVYIIFRDSERSNFVTLAINENLEKNIWNYRDLTSFSVNMWEPTYDTELWSNSNILHIFIQNVEQGDSEETANIPPQTISVLECKIVE